MRIRLQHDLLRRELSKRKLSQNGWALRLGLDRGHLSKLVRGKRPYPSAETRRKLLEGLRLPFEALFRIEDDHQPVPHTGAASDGSAGLFRLERKRLLITVPWIRPVNAGRGDGTMQTLLQDIRYSLRSFARRPGFVLLSALVLALGIGANTGIFSFVEALFLRPLDLPRSDQLVRVFSSGYSVFSYPNYLDVRDASDTLGSLAAHQQTRVGFAVGQTGAEPIQAEVVSGNYFQVLQVPALLGRTLAPEDDLTVGANPVVVVSYGLWQRSLGGDPAAAGRTAFINGHPFTVIGVAPKGFRGSYEAYPTDLWAPITMYQQVRPSGLSLDRRGWDWLQATGRLKDGASLKQARSEMMQAAQVLRESYPRMNEGLGFDLVPAGRFPESFQQAVSGVMVFLMVVVGLVLLAACGNVAGMLLARTTTRRHEIAVRMSLGAGRGRLLRQWLTESVLLSLLGAAGGVVVSVWVRAGLAGLRPPGFENFSPDARLDFQVLGFALLLSLLTALIFGVLPARRAVRQDVTGALREESPSASAGRRRTRLLDAFVIGQVAVSALLLVASGLLLRSLQHSAAFDPGFDSDQLLLAELDLRRQNYSAAEGERFFQDLAQRLSSRPEVRSTAYASVVPLGFSWDQLGLVIPGHEPPSGRSTFPVGFNQVSPGYFETMGIALAGGRDFSSGDGSQASEDPDSKALFPIIINSTMASMFWPSASPLGQRVRNGPNGAWAEIVGVAEDVRYRTLGEDPRPYLYLPYFGLGNLQRTLHIRTQSNPQSFKAALRSEIEALDAQVLPTVLTMSEMRSLPLFPGRAMAAVSAVFGVLTLLLTAVGLYGLLSYTVSRRTFEIGVRMALGADPRRVWLQITGRGVRLAAGGLAVGLLGGWGAAQALSGFLFGVGTVDPITYATVCGLLLAVALVACAMPARLASRVDPIQALRSE